MKIRSKPIKVMAMSVGSLLAFIALTILAFVYIFEANNVNRGSLLYYIGTSKYIKSASIISECKKPKFRWKGRDGENSPYTSVTYGSTHSSIDLLQIYRVEFEKQSCRNESKVGIATNNNHLKFICNNEYFVATEITIEDVDGCKDVAIDFFENY